MMQPAFHSFDTQPLAEALRPYRGQRLDVLLTEQDAEHVADLQQQCSHLEIQLSGALFPRLISRHGFHERGAWLLPRPASHAPLLIPLDPVASADEQARRQIGRAHV